MALPNLINFSRQYDISVSRLREELRNSPNLSEEARQSLHHYKLLCWNKELLNHKLTEGGGSLINRFDQEFHVWWDESCSPTARSQFISSPKDSVWKLSFRIPHPDSGLLPVVFISRKTY